MLVKWLANFAYFMIVLLDVNWLTACLVILVGLICVCFVVMLDCLWFG